MTNCLHRYLFNVSATATLMKSAGVRQPSPQTPRPHVHISVCNANTALSLSLSQCISLSLSLYPFLCISFSSRGDQGWSQVHIFNRSSFIALAKFRHEKLARMSVCRVCNVCCVLCCCCGIWNVRGMWWLWWLWWLWGGVEWDGVGWSGVEWRGLAVGSGSILETHQGTSKKITCKDILQLALTNTKDKHDNRCFK